MGFEREQHQKEEAKKGSKKSIFHYGINVMFTFKVQQFL